MNLLNDLPDLGDYNREPDGLESIRCASEYIRAMKAEIGTPAAVVPGWDLPWRKTEGLFRFHPGEVVLWAGVNGSGKSLLTGMVALDLMCRREKVCVASFEMPPRKTLQRMLRNWIGSDPARYHGHMDAEDTLRGLYEDLASMADDYLWLYDQVGSVQQDKLIAIVRYCAKKLGIKQFVLDSMMKCVAGTENYDGQKDFVNELCAIAKDYGATIHLIAHTRKLQDENRKPSKFDIAGTGAITDLVDSALVFWRNKPKEAARRRGESGMDHEPDALLICCKQRELGEEPEIGLWFDRESQSYVESPNAGPINWTERCK